MMMLVVNIVINPMKGNNMPKQEVAYHVHAFTYGRNPIDIHFLVMAENADTAKEKVHQTLGRNWNFSHHGYDISANKIRFRGKDQVLYIGGG